MPFAFCSHSSFFQPRCEWKIIEQSPIRKKSLCSRARDYIDFRAIRIQLNGIWIESQLKLNCNGINSIASKKLCPCSNPIWIFVQLKMNFAVSSKVPFELHLMSSTGGSRGRPFDHVSRDPVLIPPLVGSFPFIYNYSNNWLCLEVKLLHRNFNFRISEMP